MRCNIFVTVLVRQEIIFDFMNFCAFLNVRLKKWNLFYLNIIINSLFRILYVLLHV